MGPKALSEKPFQFGAWRVEPARGVLADLAGEREVRLEPRVMDLLLLLAGSAGRVVGKQEIVDGVWAGRAIGDDTLAAAVSRLRSALGETRERRYIETVPKRGYRLLAGAGPGIGTPVRAAAPEKAAGLAAQGRSALAAPFAASQAQARLYFEAAVSEAPGWAPAHVGLSEALTAQYFRGQGGGPISAAKASAQAAIGLEPDLAEAWAALGLAILLADRDFAAADEALRRALSLDPDLVGAHRHRAFAFAAVGRFVEAERESRRAVALDPVSLPQRGGLLQVLISARRYRQAITAANEALALSPLASDAWYAKGWALVLDGDALAGIDALMKGLELWGVDAAHCARLGALGAESFPALCKAVADLFATQTVMFTPRQTDIAFLRAAAGQSDLAFAALGAAAEHDDPYLISLPWLPYCDPLRDDPRWPRLLEKVRLVR
jgi:serine/threonine-protein kinase